jgi:hypothetical protein
MVTLFGAVASGDLGAVVVEWLALGAVVVDVVVVEALAVAEAFVADPRECEEPVAELEPVVEDPWDAVLAEATEVTATMFNTMRVLNATRRRTACCRRLRRLMAPGIGLGGKPAKHVSAS